MKSRELVELLLKESEYEARYGPSDDPEPGDEEFTPADHQQRPDWSNVKFIKGPPPAGAKRVHLYPIQDVLRPRGTPLSKESLSDHVLRQLKYGLETWTDPKYGDSMPADKVISVLKQNLTSEVEAAWEAFLGR